MKAIALTNKGIENISAAEIKEFTNLNTEIKDGFVIFDFNDFKDLFLLCYKGRSFNKIVLLLESFNFNSKEDIYRRIKDSDINDWLDADFCVNGIRQGDHDFNSFEIEKSISEIISNKYKLKLNLKNPKILYSFLINNNELYFGIDFCKDDLGKRDYRIFVSRENLKGNEAFALLKLADYNNKKILLDPFCRSGIIPIEAALYACDFPTNHYNKEKFSFLRFKKFKDFDFDDFFSKIDKKIKLDKKTNIISMDESFNNVQAARKNAKIAGVIKKIDFSKTDIYWIDVKFDYKSIDLIITMPPQPSISINKEKIEKKYIDFFKNSEQILADDGRIILAIKRGVDLIKKNSNNFNLINERIMYQGQDKINVLIFKKKKKN